MASENIDQVICGAVKHAKKQEYRDRVTRFGLVSSGRIVVDESLDYPQAIRKNSDDGDESLQSSSVVRFIKRQIRCYTDRSVYVKLIEAIFIKERSTAEVAAELGINPGTARSVVCRARSFLSLRRKPI